MSDRLAFVTIDLPDPPRHKAGVIIARTNEWMIRKIEEMGGEKYLEENGVFAFRVDDAPPFGINDIEGYGEILDCYPDSDHVGGEALYIGNLVAKGYRTRTESVIDSIFGVGQWDMVAMEPSVWSRPLDR